MAKTRTLPDKYYDKDYETNGIHRVPLWRLIDCAVTAHANRAKVPVNRKAYLRWCLLGVFGAQRFYAKQWKMGLLYLVTCWSGFSIAMTMIDAMIAVPMKPDENGIIYL